MHNSFRNEVVVFNTLEWDELHWFPWSVSGDGEVVLSEEVVGAWEAPDLPRRQDKATKKKKKGGGLAMARLWRVSDHKPSRHARPPALPKLPAGHSIVDDSLRRWKEQVRGTDTWNASAPTAFPIENQTAQNGLSTWRSNRR